MQSPIQTISPLRQRIVEDMRMCKIMPKTQSVRAPQKLPVILSKDEMSRLIAASDTSSTRRHCHWPMAPGCVLARSSRSKFIPLLERFFIDNQGPAFVCGLLQNMPACALQQRIRSTCRAVDALEREFLGLLFQRKQELRPDALPT
jgi:hypothetical protein